MGEDEEHVGVFLPEGKAAEPIWLGEMRLALSHSSLK